MLSLAFLPRRALGAEWETRCSRALWLSMLEVREVLRRDVGGAGLLAIARGTGLDRKTVAQYLKAGTGCGLHPGGAPPTDHQVAMVPSGATAAAPSG